MLEIMKNRTSIICFVLIVLTFVNCTKESGSSANTSSGAGGSTARFTIAGNYLYVVDQSSLKSFLISNPQAPLFKSKTEIGINIETIFPYGDKLFIGSSSDMYIFSLADPSRPQQVGRATYQIRMSCDPVVVQDAVAYATLRATGPCGGWGTSSLVVYDISNVSSPSLVNTVPISEPYGLGVKDSALYVCDGANGLDVFNIKNKFSPQHVLTITDKQFFDVIPYDGILICQISDGFALYDISKDATKPEYISTILN